MQFQIVERIRNVELIAVGGGSASSCGCADSYKKVLLA
jgi:hypothetical protein